jgi:L-lactate dehydrogenase
MSDRYAISALTDFVEALFQAEGLQSATARVVTRGFVEADLLGFTTHGLAKVPDNLEWLRAGDMLAAGEPQVLVDRPAIANWDARRLPGHWAMHRAVEHAIRRAVQAGSFTMVVRRCQHVACLAAALIPVVEAELVALMIVSSPEEAYVSPFGGSERLFSNNPLAFTAPAPDGPILFDVSMAVTAGGQVARAAAHGWKLPEPSLKTATGVLTDDPHALVRGGSVIPMGGAGHGHKGHALTIMTEVLTQALAGYGRARSSGASEENSVFLQVLDPTAFGDRGFYDQEMAHLVAQVAGSRPDDPDQPVRVPGYRAWQAREQQMKHGLEVESGIMAGLLPYAVAAGIEPPVPLSTGSDRG